MDYFLPNYIDIEPDINDIIEQYSEFRANIIYKAYYKVYQRTLLSEAQNYRCCWCGIRMNDIKNDPASATIEHITPRSNGGSNNFDNLVVSCKKCNNRRATLSVDQFTAVIEGRSTIDHEINKQKINKRKLQKELRDLGIKFRSDHKIPRLQSKLDNYYVLQAIKENSENTFNPGSRRYNKYQKHLLITKIKNMIKNNEPNNFEFESFEYHQYEAMKIESHIRKMIESNEPNSFAPESKEYKKYEYLKSKKQSVN